MDRRTFLATGAAALVPLPAIGDGIPWCECDNGFPHLHECDIEVSWHEPNDQHPYWTVSAKAWRDGDLYGDFWIVNVDGVDGGRSALVERAIREDFRRRLNA